MRFYIHRTWVGFLRVIITALIFITAPAALASNDCGLDFGDGSDGALTISTDTVDYPIDSPAAGNAGSSILSASNPLFAAGQKILIHQTQGADAGLWEINEIAANGGGTISLTKPLVNTYSGKAQVLVLKEYTDVSVASGVTWSAKSWDGTVGGILAFYANGTIIVSGAISVIGDGFSGGIGTQNGQGYAGEGTTGATIQQRAANGNGGGGGNKQNGAWGGGGGGGNGTTGITGECRNPGGEGIGGGTAGTADLTTMVFGGGGGGGYADVPYEAGHGGNGGGIIFILGKMLNVTGAIAASGANGAPTTDEYMAGGGGGGR